MAMRRYLPTILILIFLALIGLWSRPSETVRAQAPDTLCDRHAVVPSTASGSSVTIAGALGNQTVYICGFILSGDAATSGVKFQSNGVDITGPIRVGNALALAVSADAINIYGTPGQSVTLLVGTGNVSGAVKFGQR